MRNHSLQDWCFENNRLDLLEEWDYEKNGNLKPCDFGCHSNKMAFWVGNCGHKWESRINYRTELNCNCPYCSGKRVLVGFNDLQTKYPDIAKEWHPFKNNNLKASDVTSHSKAKVWWRCEKNHEWESTVDNRTKGNGCPYCSGRNVFSGVTDLQSKMPDIAKEWHPTKNGDLKPAFVSSGSNKKVWWLGKCGHEWQAAVCDRVSGKGCPYCANRKVLSGFNDLQTKYPSLAKEWHPTKNGNLVPTEILYGSHKKVWWMCSNDHEWLAEVRSRTLQNTACPFCSGRRVKTGVNDLQTKYPELAAEWNYDKNGNTKPAEVAFGSNEKVWWKCSKGHEWQIEICNRTGRSKTGCPYCSNKRIIAGFNDLSSLRPNLAKEWNYEKNNGLEDGNGVDISTPDKVSPVSGNYVWWKCDKGHEWKAKISNRVNGNGCPMCTKAGTSVPEQGVAFYLEQVCEVKQRIKISNNEVDVFLPEYMIGIEYDGVFYHKPQHIHKEIEKDKKLSREGVQVIRIKESDSNIIEDHKISYKFDDMRSNYEWALNSLCRLLVQLTGDVKFLNIDINVQRDLLKIRERIDLYVKKNSLSVLFPDIAKEWNFDKNGLLSPEMFTIGSDIKVWWKCSAGHEWQTSISHRTSRGDKCPYCSGKRMLKGYNDFESWCIANESKYLLEEWDYDKNITPPSDYSSQSRERVWWRCSQGHEWQTRIGQRTTGHGCPYCKGNGPKRVKNIETGEVFNSIALAGKKYNIRSQCISRCCLGEQKTAGGYHWELVK